MAGGECETCHEVEPVLVTCATCPRRCCETCLFGEDLICLPCRQLERRWWSDRTAVLR